MADPAHEFADAQLAELAEEARKIYAGAEREARAALEAFLAEFAEGDEARRRAVAAGEMEPAEWRRWRQAQMLVGRRWAAVRSQMARAYVDANQRAAEALSGRLPAVAAEAANHSAYEVEAGARATTAFALQDEDTIDVMLAQHDLYLPRPAVDVPRDERWNERVVSNQLTQGVLLGESIPKLAARVGNVTGSNVAVATRAARTAVTAAESAGRVASYRRAEDMGIQLQQEWMATLDGRTRHSHRRMDGERVEPGGTFPNGCRFPGDPEAPHAETMNCRCTLVAAIEGVDYSDEVRPTSMEMTYEEWKADRPRSTATRASGITLEDVLSMDGTWEALRYAGFSEAAFRGHVVDEMRRMGLGRTGRFELLTSGQQASVWSKAWSSLTGRVGDISELNRLQRPDSIAEALAAVNPFYSKSRLNWFYGGNCQRCVIAYEMRRRGYDVEALPCLPPGIYDEMTFDSGPGSYTRAFSGRLPHRLAGSNARETRQLMEATMKGYGDGSRAIIGVRGRSTTAGHVFIAEQVGGSTVFVDPQSGETYSGSWENEISASGAVIMRVDDLELTDVALLAVRNAW